MNFKIIKKKEKNNASFFISSFSPMHHDHEQFATAPASIATPLLAPPPSPPASPALVHWVAPYSSSLAASSPVAVGCPTNYFSASNRCNSATLAT